MTARVKRRRHVKRWRGTNYRRIRAAVARLTQRAYEVLGITLGPRSEDRWT